MEINESLLAPDFVVLLLGYSRPDLLKRRLEEIKIYNPRNLIVSVDFFSPEKQLELADLVFETNQNARLSLMKHKMGLAKHITFAVTQALLEHEYVIVVEDDVSVNQVFFESIVKYLPMMNSLGLASIGGFSPLSAPKPFGRNYFIKTKYFSSWGWATSREVWAEYELAIRKHNINKRPFSGSNWRHLSRFQKRTWEGRFRKIQEDNPHTWDIQFQFLNFRTNKSNLLPIWPLVHNEGFDDSRSAHTIGRKPNWMGVPYSDHRHPVKIVGNKFSALIYNFLVSFTIAGDRRTAIPRMVAIFLRYLKRHFFKGRRFRVER